MVREKVIIESGHEFHGIKLFLVKEEKSGKEVTLCSKLEDAEEIKKCLNSSKEVVLMVQSGCVEVDSKPDEIDIIIKDYDINEDWDSDDIACGEDEYGKYREMIF